MNTKLMQMMDEIIEDDNILFDEKWDFYLAYAPIIKFEYHDIDRILTPQESYYVMVHICKQHGCKRLSILEAYKIMSEDVKNNILSQDELLSIILKLMKQKIAFLW